MSFNNNHNSKWRWAYLFHWNISISLFYSAVVFHPGTCSMDQDLFLWWKWHIRDSTLWWSGTGWVSSLWKQWCPYQSSWQCCYKGKVLQTDPKLAEGSSFERVCWVAPSSQCCEGGTGSVGEVKGKSSRWLCASFPSQWQHKKPISALYQISILLHLCQHWKKFCCQRSIDCSVG